MNDRSRPEAATGHGEMTATRIPRIVGCRHRPGRHLTPRGGSPSAAGDKPAEWIMGRGPYATLAWCSVLTSALAMINCCCGHACWGSGLHDLVIVDGAQ